MDKITICIVAEGSYPYVTGGVSSWIQMLITSMPENEFIIFAIGAEKKVKGLYKYQLPANVIGVKEFFLDDMDEITNKKKINYKISNEDIEVFVALIAEQKVDWDKIFSFTKRYNIRNINNFLSSPVFYEIIETAYRRVDSKSPFIDFYWNVKSIIGTLLLVQSQQMPQADIYHSVSTGYAGLVGAIAKIRNNSKFILTEHGIYTREREEEIIRSDYVKGYLKDLWINYFYCISGCAYKYTDIVTTLFNKNKEIQVDLSCPEEKIMVIPNGVNIKAFEDIEMKSKDDQDINIGAVVRMVPIKDIKTMIQSFAIVKEEIFNAKFYIIGPWDEDEEYFEECKMLVELLELKDVNFTGRVNIKDYIGRMDVMVLTSISEGQPLAILEGMACKKPFVSTNVGCVKELLEGVGDDDLGPAGIVCPIMDYEAIGNAIIKIVTDPKLAEQMGKNAYARVNKYYSIEKFILQFKKLYQQSYFQNLQHEELLSLV